MLNQTLSLPGRPGIRASVGANVARWAAEHGHPPEAVHNVTYSLGWRLSEEVAGGLVFEMGVEGRRHDRLDGRGPAHEIGISLG